MTRARKYMKKLKKPENYELLIAHWEKRREDQKKYEAKAKNNPLKGKINSLRDKENMRKFREKSRQALNDDDDDSGFENRKLLFKRVANVQKSLP